MPFSNIEAKTGSPKLERLEARVSKDQKELIQRAAALQGRSLSDFLITSAYEVAVRAIREHETITLGEQDQALFVVALLNPPEPNEKLRQAAQRYKEHRD